MKDYQLIVIGAGPGGYVAALHAAQLGLRVGIVEKDKAGGTCLNRGCVPTKALLHASQVYREAKESEPIGITAQGVKADIAQIFARKRQVTEKLSDGVLAMLRGAKVDWIPGTATITAPCTVQVRGADTGIQTLTADDILVATGSVPAMPPIPGLTLPGVLTSDTLLEGCDHLYRSIVIIGGGVIGVELATFYNDLGSDVTIVEGLDRLLPNMDRELGQNLAQILKKRGVTVHTGAMVRRVEATQGGPTVHFETKRGAQSAQGEVVLCAIGRVPDWQSAFAPGLAPRQNGKALWVDEAFKTSLPHVYAIGDVSSKIQLAHAASAQATACVDGICGKKSTVALDLVPSCVYCRPEIACVGLTEQQAKEAGIPAVSGKCTLYANARTVIGDAERSFIKVVAHAADGRLLGAQLMCTNSTDMISELTVAMANAMTAPQLLRAMRPHPTYEESLTQALEALVSRL